MIGGLSINPWGKTAQRPLVSVYNGFPFGMLMPGRYISDTSDHCMTISRSNWTTEIADTCKPLATLASTGVFSAGSSISTSGSSIVLHAEEYDSWIQLTTEVEAGIDNSFTFNVPVLEGAAESGMQVMIIETRDNIPYVIGGGYLMPGGRKQTISFNASGNTVNLLFNGPFSTAEIEQICTHYTKTTQQTYLVEVCDETKDKYRFGFNGQEKVNEIAGVGNHNTALFWEYDSRVARRWNVDPMAHEREWVSPYNAMQNNPINRVDPTGALDDVIITGTESKETFSQLQSSTSLKLKIDDNGKVAATGKAKTEADKKLLEATTDGNVIVQINATSSNFTDDKKWYIGGAYQGSTVGADGKTYTRQTVNPQMTKTIDGFYEAKKGVSVLHEVLESYIGGVESPGVGGPTFDKTTPEFKAYKNAHDKTEAIDPRHKAPNISQDPNTGHLYINRPHPQFPMLNAEKLINDLSK